jgi:hypothetical protein
VVARSAATLAVIGAGCAKPAYPEAAYPSEAYDDADEGEVIEMSRGGGGGGYRKESYAPSAPPPPPPPGMAQVGGVNGVVAADMAGAEAPSAPEAPQAAARMVHYDAWVEMSAPRPREVVDLAVDLVVGFGGYSEVASDDRAVLRVPVDRFEEAWRGVQALGDVSDRSVAARDVTDAFTDVDLRLRTSRAARDRLVALLALAKDEQQQIALLRQIQRLTEEIDVLDSQMRTLSSLASFSRIALHVTGVQSWDNTPSLTLDGFAWLTDLDPFGGGLFEDAPRLQLTVPSGFVRPSLKGPFIATSADGSVLRSGRLPNEPRGTTTFWVDALEEAVAGQFAAAERIEVGGRSGLRFVGHGEEPYVWWVLMSAGDRLVDVVEVVFPTEAQEGRYGDGVREALAQGGAVAVAP